MKFILQNFAVEAAIAARGPACIHQLIRVLESRGENAAADLIVKLSDKAELARELCYRLYTSCERRSGTVAARRSADSGS